MRRLTKHSPTEVPPSASCLCSVPRNGTKTTEQGGQDPQRDGRTLYQASFFVCTVRAIAELPGAGRIYVETAVDRDSGAGFAKVYSARDPMNAVDLIESRVVPFFQCLGQEIKEIHTARTSQYCGVLSRRTFGMFLWASHIQHVVVNALRDPYSYLCEQFYCFLLKEFFQPEFRKRFHLSIEQLQHDLDGFIRAYNAGKFLRQGLASTVRPDSENFAVDLQSACGIGFS